MRLFPGVNLRIAGQLVPEIFFPAVLLPVLVFATLYAFPFIDGLVRFDFRQHNVLKLPYERPVTTAIGCAFFCFLVVLLVAGGDDVIAVALTSSVVKIRFILRILCFAAPAVTAVLAYSLCRRTRSRLPYRVQ